MSLKPRLNVNCACNTCKDLKIKCNFVDPTISTAKCTQCLKRNKECIFPEGNKKRGRKSKTQTNQICMKSKKHNRVCAFTKRKKRGSKSKDQKNNNIMKSKNNTIHESHIDQTKKICDKRDNELICDLSQEEIQILSDMYSKEELPQKVAILGSITFHPCPSMKDPGHQCHI
ncbi:19770_t:CDS:1, partial [Gigaspora margarita]